VQVLVKNKRERLVKKILYVAKSLSITLFTLILLSCHTNADKKNVTVSQKEETLQVAPLNDPQKYVETDNIANMTLIPSVEPELLRNVMPNCWRLLSRLTETEEKDFIKENTAYFLQVAELLRTYGLGLSYTRWNSTPEYCFIYRQQVGNDTFYRVLVTTDSAPDFLSHTICFYQYLIYEGAPIYFAGPYNKKTATQREHYSSFYSLDIIHGAERAKGIMETELIISPSNKLNWSEDAMQKNGQLYGDSESHYYLMEDLLNGNRSPIRINATDCLVDHDIPLRYSLQNAFDGDPSTSYVENTDDNLIEISLSFLNNRKIKQIAIINGYSQDKDLYIMNNRAKEISVETYQLNSTQTELKIIFLGRWLLEDNTLNYQFVNIEKLDRFKISDIFLGTTYNNTSIAELNFLTDNGWLFGDLYE
jgi:hypothetical protein